jgi:ribosomal protein S18 acetylase RimI-like enzyme
MPITIRDATPQDTPAIVRLIRELAATGGEDSPLTETYAARYLAEPACTVLLAESEQQVIGLLSYSLRPNLYHAAATCLIEELVVQETERGHGVGNLLLEELLRRLPALGCAEVSVTTMPDNTAAIRFYRKHGLVDEALYLERHLFQ